jgi:multiple sugar transport system substrate-binding protein
MIRIKMHSSLLCGVVAVALSSLVLAGCTTNPKPAAEATKGKAITVWTTDTLPDRVAATKAIIAKFTAATGIDVKLVGVAEDQFNQVLTSSVAANTLPDVFGSVSLPQVRALAADDLVDTTAAAAVVKDLGKATFNPRALELTKDGDKQLAVPSDFWPQLLFYRKDLFAAAGLAAPKTYSDILADAKALNSPKVAGFVGATTTGAAFTQQTFEHIALANNCQMVNNSGKITLDSPECANALNFYGDLIKKYSTVGAQDVDTVRASYFAGKAAMMIWSSYVLDEMAGLRKDAKPSCPQCVANPTFLAKNTGIVSAIQGPDSAKAAQFGEVASWTIRSGGATDSAKKFVQYMLGDGYLDWISFAPEGKIPVRQGTQQKPTEFADAWKTLPVGVDTKAPLADFYPADVLKGLQDGINNVSRWGITQRQGALVGASYGELPVATAVSDAANGGVDAKTAIKKAAAALVSIQASLK